MDIHIKFIQKLQELHLAFYVTGLINMCKVKGAALNDPIENYQSALQSTMALITHFQVLSVTLIEYGQSVNKHHISKLFWEKWVGLM